MIWLTAELRWVSGLEETFTEGVPWVSVGTWICPSVIWLIGVPLVATDLTELGVGTALVSGLEETSTEGVPWVSTDLTELGVGTA